MSLLPRRTFLTGLFFTPAIVRAGSLMPVRVWVEPSVWQLDPLVASAIKHFASSQKARAAIDEELLKNISVYYGTQWKPKSFALTPLRPFTRP